ncbi:histidine triad nucleotide-binding protein [Sphaerobacter thermophilus]|jgi:histidine triad (HIT) family protein|uniref:Histidine triad (HIT) protein n=1 Tax=Sphaerobacter thermophilus (strain ATCC 49802 / DSM 20745 / KCCM 41009 / NCIMB 13125 / S 6022) TaxID=479434 RepID=D1C1V6_SPHTD|nr:histidine triad nucleotide-binding protein [Sphaerobacter thermophilus]ACZ38223.1 histidine triad (HIT) protein [Sphaerobacter thermophilus DSM 20745]PZN67584.1 MAG: histidine triad nucleotide-binding protein [Sphaerobacter thermophilus]
MANDCIFCRIVAGELPATIVYQDDEVTAFNDINPQASTHVLVIPNQHITSLNDAEETDPALLGRLLQVAAKVARDAGLAESGYRVVTNTGPDSGQTVFHLHFHVLGGNPLRLPLG